MIKQLKILPEQIYNADETGLYWKCLPNKTLAYEVDKNASGHKMQKQRLTIMCSGNASGSHFNKLCVIGTAKKPRVFQSLSIENLPVD